MKTTDYRNKIQNIERQLSEQIWELRGYYPQIPFNLPDADFEDYIEMRNDITGNVFDTHLLYVDTHGFKVVEADDTDKTHTVGLHEFSSLEDRVNILELMELQISKINSFIEEFGTEVRDNEKSSYVELMIDNHKCIKWGNKQYYIPEDGSYANIDQEVYNLLVEYNHV